MTSRSRRARAATAGLALAAVGLVPALQHLPASAADDPSRIGLTSLTDPDSFVTLGDSNVLPGVPEITDVLDASGKVVRVAPTAAQRAAAAALPAGSDVQWGAGGTPASVYTPSGVLLKARAGESAEAVARRWVAGNLGLLGITAAQAADFEIISDQPLADSPARAVLFRQSFGGLPAATRGMLTVGVGADGDVTYVSSSLDKAQGAVPDLSRVMTPAAGWLKAAASVRPGVALGTPKVLAGPVTGATAAAASLTDAAKAATTTADAATNAAWTKLRVSGFAQTQQVRLRAFTSPDGTVRPVYEANVVNNDNGNALAYRVMVDAVSGAVLFRQNAVENSQDAFPFQGDYPGDGCGDKQMFTTTDNNTKSIVMTAAAAIAADDIRIKLFNPAGLQLGDYDLSTSPEAAVYSAPLIPAGTYSIQVCSFDANQTGGPYVATVATSDTAVGAQASLPNPNWRAFAANPTLASAFAVAPAAGAVPTNTTIECWFATSECASGEVHQNVSAFGAWDTQNGAPSLTTVGNNANTHEAWASFLTPGGTEQAPVSPTRQYTDAFTDDWNESGCLSTFTPGDNDILAVTTNLFTGHNRIHDYSYALGFTEKNYNLQTVNGDRGGQGGDFEIGNVQAGAATGGAAGMYMGRDNANQIALQDGVPGITNQYLFQPIAAAFYTPCTDGALDTGIYGHEYTHAISNRMVGGPDDGLTSEQGGAMGESWSDLNASEYQFENDYFSPPGVVKNPWALGAYTTGNPDKGIRDYALNDNPLNYSDYGFDTTGAEVHADGEIWNGTQWEVRQALVNKWDAAGFKYTDKALQERCEQPTADITNPQLSAAACPGNRRWIQLIFDAWLLQPGATDMLQARNAMMAADQMRFGGANQDVMAKAFARRGMGADAVTSVPEGGGEDVTTPSFRSALGNNSQVTFASRAGAAGKVYVGDYEARATPIADTDPTTALPATASFTPGIYNLTYASPTQGFRRFRLTVLDDGKPVAAPIDDTAKNLASSASGASLIGASADSLNAAALIDGTEETNWGGQADTNIDDAAVHPSVSVALAGGLQTITSAKVSALLHPAPAAADPTGLGIPVAEADDDPLSGSRFTALRKFALEACTANCAAATATWTRFFTSPDDAFPSVIPRPVAPDQIMRSFTFPATQAAAVRLVALENQCTGQAAYAGEQDNDPTNATDCKTASERGQVVHAAELQVFGAGVPADPAAGTPGTGVPGSGTAGQGTSTLPTTGQPSLGGSTSGINTAGATSPVKVRTKTRIRLPRVQQVKGKESTKMVFAVVGKGGSSMGRKVGIATVKLDGRKVKRTKVVVRPKQGKKVVGKSYRVRKSLGYGKHTLQVTFKSSVPAQFTSSKSRKITITVVRSRPNARS